MKMQLFLFTNDLNPSEAAFRLRNNNSRWSTININKTWRGRHRSKVPRGVELIVACEVFLDKTMNLLLEMKHEILIDKVAQGTFRSAERCKLQTI
jgi:hypothetical protein